MTLQMMLQKTKYTDDVTKDKAYKRKEMVTQNVVTILNVEAI